MEIADEGVQNYQEYLEAIDQKLNESYCIVPTAIEYTIADVFMCCQLQNVIQLLNANNLATQEV